LEVFNIELSQDDDLDLAILNAILKMAHPDVSTTRIEQSKASGGVDHTLLTSWTLSQRSAMVEDYETKLNNMRIAMLFDRVPEIASSLEAAKKMFDLMGDIWAGWVEARLHHLCHTHTPILD
jgi:hypothetical protein